MSDTKYTAADTKYGYLVDRMRQDFPKSLAVAHICSVNPTNIDNPVGTNYRRGFMLASISAARRVNVGWQRLIDPVSCAYAWFTDANRVSYLFYSDKVDFFSVLKDDFWKCAYLKIVLEDAAFDALWTYTNPTTTVGDIYPQLTAAITTLKASLPGWTVPTVKNRVLLNMAAAFTQAKANGTLSSSGPGRPPYLSQDDANRIFLG